jgi:hypothetical protein
VNQTSQMLCATRAMKNGPFVRSTAPNLMPAVEPPDGFGSVIPLHRLGLPQQRDPPADSRLDTKVARVLKSLEFPRAASVNVASLFKGELLSVHIHFTVVEPKQCVYLSQRRGPGRRHRLCHGGGAPYC